MMIKTTLKKATKVKTATPRKTSQQKQLSTAEFLVESGENSPSNQTPLPLTDQPETTTETEIEETTETSTLSPSTKSKTASEVEVICSSREFNDYVQSLKVVIPSNSNHQILSNILIEADVTTQKLHLTTYNLECGLQVSFDATVNQPGSLTLPAPILAEIIGEFPSGRLTFNSEVITSSTNTSSVSATIKMSGSYHVLRGLVSDQFPPVPQVEQKLFSLPGSVLLAALKGSLFAVSSDEVKRIITGVHFQLSYDSERELNQLRIWTTDGHRVAMILGLSESNEHPNPLINSSVQFTVPAKTLKVLERNLTSSDRLSIYYNNSAQTPQNCVAFRWKNWCLTSQLLEGEYPDCNQIINPYRNQFNRELQIERLALLKALERLATHSDKSHVTVILEFNCDRQQVQASINNALSTGTEIVDAKIIGGDLKLKCDIRYLIETVKAISSSALRFCLTAPTAPILISPFETLTLGEVAIASEYILAPQE